MYRLIPIGSFLFNFAFFYMFVKCLRMLLPQDILILGKVHDMVLAIILYIIVLMLLYTRNGQRFVAFCANGRSTIGREEKKIQPLVNDLIQNTDIEGLSSPIIFKYKVLNYFNSVTLGKISVLNNSINRIKHEFKVGTVKLFTFDSLDLESNSFGNSIFLAKGAIDNLPENELKAVIYNEFAQVKHNISNKRLLHQAGILIARLSCVFIILLVPIVYYVQFLQASVQVTTMLEFIGNMIFLVGFMLIAIIRLFVFYTLWKNRLDFTNIFYMFYERNIFLEADRATDRQGLSKSMLSYLEKLYNFKLKPKDLGKLFAELRPLVAYRINYYDNVLGRNKDLDENNVKWSSNYMKYVEVLMNKKK